MRSSSRGSRRGLRRTRRLLGVLLLCGPAAASADDVLVPAGAAWSFHDDGSYPGPGWQLLAFDDSGWRLGPGPLGFGDGDEATLVDAGSADDPVVTTYFRHRFQVFDPGALGDLTLSLQRDDGAIVYLNGTEVARSNMPDGPVDAATRALEDVSDADESTFWTTTTHEPLLVEGENVLAVEVHQSQHKVKDQSFDLALSAALRQAQLERPPYLQKGTSHSMVVRWRTTEPNDSRILWGSAPDDLSNVMEDTALVTEHEWEIRDLAPGSRVYYAVGTRQEILAGGDAEHVFTTAPAPGTRTPIRVWVAGDSGSCGSSAIGCERVARVRDAYLAFRAGNPTDVWLMLGDNAYSYGSDTEYTRAVFDVFPTLLRSTVLWPAPGNHEFGRSDSPSQSGPYYEAFTLPTAGEAGGLPSGTEAYYAFDHGNVHFVALDSHDTDRSAPSEPMTRVCAPGEGGAMYQWLCADLAATTQDFVIVYWHHPPYSKGSHDSDGSGRMEEMRERFVPVLEDFGVDLQLTGHSHAYERSILLDSHYGRSNTFDPALHALDVGDGDPDGDGVYQKPALGPNPHQGAVYTVVGSSSRLTGGSLDHPVMTVAVESLGSLAIDVVGRQLDAFFIDDAGSVHDHFRILKGPPLPACSDGLDNDGDGMTDFEDPVCGGRPERVWEDAACQDGLDNDGDGTVDFDGGLSVLGSAAAPPDPRCHGAAWVWFEGPLVCGLGFETALVLVLWRLARRRRRV